MADQITHQIVGLIEHAEACQKAADDARKAMLDAAAKLTAESKAQDDRLARTVELAARDSIRQAFDKSLTAPLNSLQTASNNLDRAIARLGWKTALVAASAVAAALLAPVLVWLLLVPSDLPQLRAEQAQLTANVEALKAMRNAYSTCGPKRLPCAHVDTSTAYGTGRDYYLLKP